MVTSQLISESSDFNDHLAMDNMVTTAMIKLVNHLVRSLLVLGHLHVVVIFIVGFYFEVIVSYQIVYGLMVICMLILSSFFRSNSF